MHRFPELEHLVVAQSPAPLKDCLYLGKFHRFNRRQLFSRRAINTITAENSPTISGNIEAIRGFPADPDGS